MSCRVVVRRSGNNKGQYMVRARRLTVTSSRNQVFLRYRYYILQQMSVGCLCVVCAVTREGPVQSNQQFVPTALRLQTDQDQNSGKSAIKSFNCRA